MTTAINGSASDKTRSYSEAIERLNSLQSNAATIAQIRQNQSARNDLIIPESLDYLRRIGYSPEDLNALSVIHITGTKGKGSTSAFCSSLLTSLPDAESRKVGLYTSPHLVAVRERIRINGKPIEEELFAKYFFEVWERFEAVQKNVPSATDKPAYFRFMTMLAYHVFLSEKVDATILEVGIGGLYDSTNLVPRPIVAGVSALGIDHVAVLGKTLGEIAWQKSGIFKPGVPAISVHQPDEGMKVLRERAVELKASEFKVVSEDALVTSTKLGLAGAHQQSNASLAMELVRTFLRSPFLPSSSPFSFARSLSAKDLDEHLREGLEKAHWPGRCQTVQDKCESGKQLLWYLDGAHTLESLAVCGEWYRIASALTTPTSHRSLIFNCTSGRAGGQLLEQLLLAINGHSNDTSPGVNGSAQLAQPFDEVIFCTNATYASGDFKGDLTSALLSETELQDLPVQHELAAAWKQLTGAHGGNVHILPSVQHAVEKVRGVGAGKPSEVLVTGSLHLVGGVMEVAGLQHAL